MTSFNLKEYRYYNDAQGAPKSAVIMLHGLGADGEDLISLAPYLANELPNTVFYAPNAPFPNDMVPEGMDMGYQWFSLRSTDPTTLAANVAQTAPMLDAYITSKLVELKIASEKIALLGFSQGSMMGMYVAPRRADSLAGVLAYSGALIGAEGLEGIESLKKIPMHLVHGTEDEIVPFAAHEPAVQVLESLGFPVDTTVCDGVAHSISEEGIREGLNFLKKQLK